MKIGEHNFCRFAEEIIKDTGFVFDSVGKNLRFVTYKRNSDIVIFYQTGTIALGSDGEIIFTFSKITDIDTIKNIIAAYLPNDYNDTPSEYEIQMKNAAAWRRIIEHDKIRGK